MEVQCSQGFLFPLSVSISLLTTIIHILSDVKCQTESEGELNHSGEVGHKIKAQDLVSFFPPRPSKTVHIRA